MRRASLAAFLMFCLTPTAQAAPLSPQQVRDVLAPSLSVCMEIPVGAFRIEREDRALEAQVNGLEDRGLVTVRTIGQGDSLATGASDLDRLEEAHVFSRLVDVTLAQDVDRRELCTLPRHRVGVPLGAQTVSGLTSIEPAGDGAREAKLIVEGTLDRLLSRYALRYDPSLTTRAIFRAELVYDLSAKAWVVRAFATQNVGTRTN